MTRKVDKRGRSKGSMGSFVALERYMMQTVAYRSLSPNARASYLEVCFGYDGKNNGRILLSAQMLADRLNRDKSTAARALKELERLGFIECLSKGGFNCKIPHASEWRLSAFKCNITGELPTKGFMHWTPEFSKRGGTGEANSGTGATDSTKATRNSPSQWHRRNREAQIDGVRGGTGATLLKSNHTPSPQTPSVEAQAGAAIHRASAKPSLDGNDSFAPLKAIAIKSLAHLDRGGPELGAVLKRLASAINRKSNLRLLRDFQGLPIVTIQDLEKNKPDKFRSWASLTPLAIKQAKAA